MKRLVAVVTPAILPVGLILFGLTDLKTSVADTSIPDNKITTSQTRASNSCVIPRIMIAWTSPSGEGGSNGLQKAVFWRKSERFSGSPVKHVQ